MKNYKAPDNSVHVIDQNFDYLLPPNCVEITDEEAESLRQKPDTAKVASISMRQARLALYDEGLLDTVDESLSLMPIESQRRKAQIEWEFSSVVERSSALVFGLAGALGLNEDALDDLFEKASKL